MIGPLKRFYASRLNDSGDTIVEVMLSMALLSLILYTCWGVMNRAVQIQLTARQRTVMVNSLKEQAETILAERAAKPNATTVNGWLQSVPATVGTTPGTNPCNDAMNANGSLKSPGPTRAFYLTSDSGSVSATTGFKRVGGDPTAIVWIQRSDVADAINGNYTDFYIRGCWLSRSGIQKLRNSQFVVRINQ